MRIKGLLSTREAQCELSGCDSVEESQSDSAIDQGVFSLGHDAVQSDELLNQGISPGRLGHGQPYHSVGIYAEKGPCWVKKCPAKNISGVLEIS